MVKFGRHKLKALNKLAKKQNATAGAVSNKILKKKINVEKKVTFQKEILIKDSVSDSPLVQNVTAKKIQDLLAKDKPKKKGSNPKVDNSMPKIKAVEKQKKRHKTQVNDTKLLLKLMKKK